MQTVFVYGTLRHGEPNHFLLANAESLGDGETAEQFTLLNLGDFPAAIVGPAAGGLSPIQGEVYRVDSVTFARLDRLEGYPRLYRRGEFPIRLSDGRTVSAWMYFLAPDGQRFAEEISTGDWLNRTPPVISTNRCGRSRLSGGPHLAVVRCGISLQQRTTRRRQSAHTRRNRSIQLPCMMPFTSSVE